MRPLFLVFFFPTITFSQNWVQIWADEFNGNSLNTAHWQPEIGTGNWGWGNNELQYYNSDPNTIFVDTGYLHIVGRNQSFQGSNYTSARIKTEGLFEFQYGKVEARIKVPVDQGLWPAFWMLGADFSTVGWPYCGEIDIMEHINNELKVHGTIHYDQWGHTYEGDFAYADASIFHTYGIEWDANEIRWYLDGTQYHQTNIGEGTSSREEFHTPFFFILNLAIGGNWPGSPDATTAFPATMFVDYVRVFQTANSLQDVSQGSVSVSPNPASEQLLVQCSVQFDRYRIINLHGKIVQEGRDTVQIDVSKLKKGMYILELDGELGQKIRSRFLKE